MKIIIPVAGIGTRLRPHTHTVPKVLLMVAGKTILGHILDRVKELQFTEIVFIVGYMKDKIKEFVHQNYSFKASYVEQKERLGLGHAIWLTKDKIKQEPCLIVYGDTIFDANLKEAFNTKIDGSIGVKTVKDPRSFGVVEITRGYVKQLVEKPEQPVTNLAIVGVNYIHNTPLLFQCLDKIVTQNVKTKDEFQLTDALQLMIDKGAKMKTFPVTGWFDCGKPEALLSTNRTLLQKVGDKITIKGSIIISPVSIHPTALIKNSIIGPYVSIAENTTVKHSIISNSIINPNATVENQLLSHSIIGDNAVVIGTYKKLNVGDSSTVASG